jgi:hypothetical protein
MHQLPTWGGISGRLVQDAPGSVSIKLDQDVIIPAGVGNPFKIAVWTAATGSDVIQLRRVVAQPGNYAAGTTLTISPNWDVGDHPKKGDVYSAGLGISLDDSPNKGPFKLYRIASIQARGDGKRIIRAVNYDPNDYVLPFAPPEPPPRPRVINAFDIPPPVIGLNVKDAPLTVEQVINATQGAYGAILVSWANPWFPYPFKCRIYGRVDTLNESTMNLVGTTASQANSFLVRNLVEGWKYTVAVVPMSFDEEHYLGYDDPKTQRTQFTVQRSGWGPPELY